MMQLLELMPLVAFFAAYRFNGVSLQLGEFHYQLAGIYGATAVLMLATLLQLLIVWCWKREVEKRLWWLVTAVWVFGTATLLFHDQRFIQWKPTIFNWVLGSILLGSHLFTRHNLVQRMLGQQLQLPDNICARLAWLWSLYFFLVGALNLVVAYYFSEGFWVSYKLWSAIVFTLVMSIITALVLMPYLKVEVTADADHTSDEPTRPL
jgi:intracellular septation protein